MPTTDTLQAGAILRGKYRVERVLGTGGMGTVVLATHLRMSQLVAIKLLLPEHRERAEIVQRFAREARAASKLRGEHAVRIHDVDDSEGGDPFLVMEYLEGMDLERVLVAQGPLSPEIAASYILQACEGIAEAHALGIIHRDIKPANLFLTTRPDDSPLVKILDFGISKTVDQENLGEFLVTRPLSAIGSPSYMSPEQLKDTADVDARTDIWSLGVVLYQLLSNALPFEATTTAALAARIAADPPAPLRLAGGLQGVVKRCLEKDRERRFADITELAHALGPFATHGEAGAIRIARVAATTARRGSTAPSTPAPATDSGTDTTLAAGPPTASIHDLVPTAPLKQALVTEYGSAVGSTDPQEILPSPRRARWVLPFSFVALAIFAAWFVVPRGPAGASDARIAAPPPETPTPSAVAAAIPFETSLPTSAPVAAEVAIADAAAPSARATSRDGPRELPRPPSTKSSAAPKNPMEIEFR